MLVKLAAPWRVICHDMRVSVLLPKSLDGVLAIQANVVTTSQALQRGKSGVDIARLTRTGQWQRLHRGVYYVFNSPVPRDAQLWAAVLRTGHGAVLSRETA